MGADGRFEESEGTHYYIKAFMKRAQYSGVSSGSKRLPLESQLDGEMMPGASGDSFYYRGYALLAATVPANIKLEDVDEGLLTFSQVTGQPIWLEPGTVCELAFGDDPIMRNARVERSSGIFGGQGIDEIIYKEIGGVQFQVTGGEVQN